MGALGPLLRNGLRRRATSLAGLSLVVALGLGTTLASVAIAWRTEHAYPSYLRKAAAADLVVNPSLDTDHIVDVIASTPGVVSATRDSLFLATPDDGHPRTIDEDSADVTQIRVSKDGRYLHQDRPVVHRGRMIAGDGEAFLSVAAAEALGFDVGDQVPIAFWQVTPSGPVADPNALIEPIGRTTARVVGVGVFADEVLPDELYPRRRIVLSPDLSAPYDCARPHPPADDSLTIEQIAPSFFQEGCARDPGFVSLRVAGGERGVPAVIAALTERVDAENAGLPKAMRDLEFGFTVIPTVTGEERARVQRSLAPTVRALQLFALVAALATLIVAGLAAVRASRRMRADARVWFALGMTRGQRIAAAGLPLAVAGAAGVLGAVVVAWLASGIGPVASAAALDPDPSRSLPAAATAGALVVSVAALVAAFAWAAQLPTREGAASRLARPSRVAALALRAGHVPLALGVRAAMPNGAGGRASSGAVLGGAVAAIAAVVASAVFSVNLSGLVGSGERFGWPFDVAAIVNFGFGGADETLVADALDRDDVAAWGLAALPGEVTYNSEAIPTLGALTGFDHFRTTVVAGRYPSGADEVALGTQSAKHLGLAPGDRVTVSTNYGQRDARVSGLVVLPALGTFTSDRLGLGTGALLSADFLDAVIADAERQRGLPPGELRSTLGTFIAFDLRDGVDAGRFAREIEPQVKDWDINAFPGVAYGRPVRPPEIADVAAMRSVPIVLVVLLSATMAIALALAIALGTRARRFELAVLRALGCTGAQLRSTVRWHALAVVAVGAALGVLLGMSLGSITWRAFSENLGTAPVVNWPVGWIALVVAGALLLSLAAGVLPAWSAARRPATELLVRP